MGQKIYKIVQNILFGIAAFLIVVTISCFLFHIKPCVVVSGSMEPKIMTGSLCMIKENSRVPQKGDIVAFQRGKITVVHRIVKEVNGGYVTKGDNNDAEDPGVLKKENIKGFEMFSVPGIGYIVKWLQTAKGIIITITGIITFFLIGCLIPEEKKKK